LQKFSHYKREIIEQKNIYIYNNKYYMKHYK
jgi:hypothetical protein